MKERGILFSAPMVRAILEGRKTQTRRRMRLQPNPFTGTVQVDGDCAYWDGGASDCGLASPYGGAGDRLWVKETWADLFDATGTPDDRGSTLYRATDPGWDDNDTGLRWRPSIFMPRGRSRITLEVTGLHVERLQFISEADATAEGVDCIKAKVPSDRDAYRYLWEEINGAGSWAENPWVWVVEFRPLESPRKVR